MYDNDQFLTLAGVQHYIYCPRQWALITLEGVWADNIHTVQGNIVHERAHDEQVWERVGSDLIVVRGLQVQSRTLGITGVCDVVEFHSDSEGVPIHGEGGKWRPYPVEYKKGLPKEHNADRAQLCAQAMCLEEMLGCEIREGALYYATPARRTTVPLTTELREIVSDAARHMHTLAERGHTPVCKPRKGCRACSVQDHCVPRLPKRPSVAEYMRRAVSEAD